MDLITWKTMMDRRPAALESERHELCTVIIEMHPEFQTIMRTI